MNIFYTATYIRKEDNKVLRRFVTKEKNKFLRKKQFEEQLNKLLNLYDLERRDVLVKEYDGADDSND